MNKLLMPVLAAATLLGASSANAQDRVQIGTLNCTVAPGIGMIITERKDMTCNLNNRAGDVVDKYVGVIQTYGLELGKTEGGYMSWTVFAPTNGPKQGALAGTYLGVTAGASVGVGGAANILAGGSDRAIQLQPLSLEGQKGINIAAGISELRLREAK